MISDAIYVHDLISRTLLKVPKLYSPEAVKLMFYTAVIESTCGKYLDQLGGGPGMGIMGVEPSTMFDHYRNFLFYRERLKNDIRNASGVEHPTTNALRNKHGFNILMGRLKYYRSSGALKNDIEWIAKYHEDVYNTNELNYPGPDWQYSLDKYIKFVN